MNYIPYNQDEHDKKLSWTQLLGTKQLGKVKPGESKKASWCRKIV